jgi:MAGUK p55 subfamily member 3/7
MYETRAAEDFERDELKTYEEVARLYPRPDLHRPIVLIGASGIGRNELKRRLILMAPDRFGTTVPHTSRAPKQGETPGVEYHFTNRSQMEQWAREGRFIEFGEYKGNLYGTTIDTVRSVMAMGRTCVLNPHPQAIRILRSPDLKPYIVYVKPPSFSALKATRQAQRIRSTFDPNFSRGFTDEELERMLDNATRLEHAYGSYFDYVLINDQLETAFKELLDALARLETQPQWVPSSWVR